MFADVSSALLTRFAVADFSHGTYGDSCVNRTCVPGNSGGVPRFTYSPTSLLMMSINRSVLYAVHILAILRVSDGQIASRFSCARLTEMSQW
jgi:hypothetical protein